LIHSECDGFYVVAFIKPINLPDGFGWIDASTVFDESTFKEMFDRGHAIPHLADYVRLLVMQISPHGRAIFADGDMVVLKKMIPPSIVHGHWFATLRHNPVS
jgi:hypothetical protein